ncbi:MAG: trypsin-like peptidase domain-containing protein [Bacteroidota bacterium]|nr:trypsin-like peptidase domain-containing protein [Bacteroidota bacterium]
MNLFAEQKKTTLAPTKKPNGAHTFADFSFVGKKVVPAIVNITVPMSKTSEKRLEYYKQYYKSFGDDIDIDKYRHQSIGSGVIFSPEGYIVTNNHVVDDVYEDSILVTLNDGRSYYADLLGTDKSTDLAVLRIYGKDFPYVSFANSDSLMVGDWVVAVGSPLGLNSTVTTGIVSALNRDANMKKDDDKTIRNFIQVDAAINPGNSGGGLFDLDGALVGINWGIWTNTGYFLGYGFSIPGNLVRNVIEDLIPDGKIQRATLGIGASDLTEMKCQAIQLDRASAVQVDEFDKGSAADLAGLKAKDVILSVNGFPIRNASDLQSMMAMHAIGDKIDLKVWRDQKELPLTATLQAGDELPTDYIRRERVGSLGIDPGPFPVDTARVYGWTATAGVEIERESDFSAALKAGLVNGDVIVAAGGTPIASADDLSQKLSSAKPGQVISISVLRGKEKITKDVILQSKAK